MSPATVECLVLEASWYGGQLAEPGAVVTLSRSEADYLCHIGRVQRVPEVQPVVIAETVEAEKAEEAAECLPPAAKSPAKGS